MFGAQLVLAVVDAVPDAVIDGGWGVDALVGRQTRDHDDLDLVIRSNHVATAVDALARLGFRITTDERPTRLVVSRSDGRRVDLHLVEQTSSGTTQRLPGGRQFTYLLDRTSGTIDGRVVRCLSPEMQVLTHVGYEPDADDRADVGQVAALSGLALPPPYAAPLVAGNPVPVREASVADVAAACTVRQRSWQAAYAGLMPQPVIDALDLGTMWSAWRATVHRPPSSSTRLFVGGPSGEVHSYAWARPTDGRREAAEGGCRLQRPHGVGDACRLGRVQHCGGPPARRGISAPQPVDVEGQPTSGPLLRACRLAAGRAEHTTDTAVGSYVEVRYRPVES